MDKTKNYIIIVLLVLVGILSYFHIDNEEIEDIVIITDEKIGEVEKEVEASIPDTVYIEVKVPGKSQPQKKEIVVDSIYKADYEKAIKDNDSLKAKNLFLESISLNTWNGNLIDNKDIKIDGEFLTRGRLLEYKVDYKIKSDTIVVKPKIEYRHPKLTLLPGIKLSMPMDPISQTKPLLELNLGIQGKKGNIFSFGFDTEKRITLGYNHSFKIIK